MKRLLILALLTASASATTYNAATCARADVLAQVNTAYGGTSSGGAVPGDTVSIPACALDSNNISSMSRDASNNVTAVLSSAPDGQYFVGGLVCVVNSLIAGTIGNSTTTFNGCFTLTSVSGSTLGWTQTGASGVKTADNVGFIIGCGTPDVAPSNCWLTAVNITGAINFVGQDTVNPNLICDPGGFLGAATSAGCGSVAGGNGGAKGVSNTVIVDAVPKGAAGCEGGDSLIKMNPTAVTGWRISALTIQGGAHDNFSCSRGHLNVGGGSQSFRIDNVTLMDSQTNALFFNGYLWGLVDHVTMWSNHAQMALMGADQWGGLGTYSFGDGSWYLANTYGTNQQIILENIVCNEIGASGTNCVGNDGDGGRWTVRQSIVTSVGGHGTETPGRHRSMRHVEMYNNSVRSTINGNADQSGLGTLFGQRGGSGIIFNNAGTTTIGANYTHSILASNFRDSQFNVAVWGGCDGRFDATTFVAGSTLPWDTTDGVLYYTGNPSIAFTDPSAGTAATLTDRTQSWGVNALVGYSVINITKSPNWIGVITSNTATTVTSGPDSNGGGLHSWATTDTYNIRKAYPCLDQAGRGSGALVTGATPVLSSTGFTGPVNEVSEPDYAWNNTRNGVAVYIATNNAEGGSGHIQVNRDYYDDGTGGVSTGLLASRPATCTPSVAYWATDNSRLYQCSATDTWSTYYTPYVYPHPLQNVAHSAVIQGGTQISGSAVMK